MKLISFIIIATAYFNPLLAQVDTGLLREVRKKLAEKANVSEILSDSKFVRLHPEPSFRELIRQHADASGKLTIVNKSEPGKLIKVVAKISSPDGTPVAGALVYLYQTDARGWYAADAPHVLANEGDMRHARLFGYVKTDQSGQIELTTVKPSGYPQSDLPAHIHVHIWADGYRNLVNEFLFDDDDRLVGEIRQSSIRHRLMIAKPLPGSKPFAQEFHYDIRLRKD